MLGYYSKDAPTHPRVWKSTFNLLFVISHLARAVFLFETIVAYNMFSYIQASVFNFSLS